MVDRFVRYVMGAYVATNLFSGVLTFDSLRREITERDDPAIYFAHQKIAEREKDIALSSVIGANIGLMGLISAHGLITGRKFYFPRGNPSHQASN